MTKDAPSAKIQPGTRVQVTDPDSDSYGVMGTVQRWPTNWTATFADPVCVHLDSDALTAQSAAHIKVLKP